MFRLLLLLDYHCFFFHILSLSCDYFFIVLINKINEKYFWTIYKYFCTSSQFKGSLIYRRTFDHRAFYVRMRHEYCVTQSFASASIWMSQFPLRDYLNTLPISPVRWNRSVEVIARHTHGSSIIYILAKLTNSIKLHLHVYLQFDYISIKSLN